MMQLLKSIKSSLIDACVAFANSAKQTGNIAAIVKQDFANAGLQTSASQSTLQNQALMYNQASSSWQPVTTHHAGGAISSVVISNSGSGYNITGLPGVSIVSPKYQPMTYFNSDVIITDEHDQKIQIGKTLNIILERVGILIPDQHLIDKFPAVKAAWEEYNTALSDACNFLPPELKSAIDSYKTTLALVKQMI